MDAFFEFTSSWTFIGIMIFLLLALVGVLVWRLVFSKKDED